MHRAGSEQPKTVSKSGWALERLLEKAGEMRPATGVARSVPTVRQSFSESQSCSPEKIITAESNKKLAKKLAFVTIIPKRFKYMPDEFDKIDVRKANRWFKDKSKLSARERS